MDDFNPIIDPFIIPQIISLISVFGEIKRSENNIILFFSLGSGKTTLINKFCGKDFITDNKDFSCIRERHFAHSLTSVFPLVESVSFQDRAGVLQKCINNVYIFVFSRIK